MPVPVLAVLALAAGRAFGQATGRSPAAAQPMRIAAQPLAGSCSWGAPYTYREPRKVLLTMDFGF